MTSKSEIKCPTCAQELIEIEHSYINESWTFKCINVDCFRSKFTLMTR